MKKIFLFICLAGATIVFSCSDAQDNLFTPGSVAKDMTLVTIAMGSPEEVAANPSVIDRVLKFFGSRAEAASMTPPAFFGSATLTITGLDFGVVTHEFVGTPVQSVSVTVPAGNYRFFELIAYASITDRTAIASYRGTIMQNLEGGASVTIPLAMNLYETKIVIPDYNYGSTGRIIQINDMTGFGWVENNTFSVIDYYYDVDFDNKGRIYVANYAPSAPPYIFRLNTIYDTSVTNFTVSSNQYTCIAVDKTRSIVYYATAGAIFSNNLDGTNNVSIVTGYSNITGLAVDEVTGNLYIAFGSTVRCIHPSAPATIIAFATMAGTCFDVIVKNSYVYVTQNGSQNNVMQYNMNLGSPIAILTSKMGGGDVFYRPKRFIAILNKKFYVIDDHVSDSNYERIVAFDGMDGSGWQTFKAEQIGKSHMSFYMC